MEQEKHAQNEEMQTLRLKMESEISVKCLIHTVVVNHCLSVHSKLKIINFAKRQTGRFFTV